MSGFLFTESIRISYGFYTTCVCLIYGCDTSSNRSRTGVEPELMVCKIAKNWAGRNAIINAYGLPLSLNNRKPCADQPTPAS
jgi:hypothetical protein